MAEESRVAVIVPVRDEAESLPSLLDDLAAQSPPLAEIVVVDAGSRDASYDLARRARERISALTVLRVEGATPGRGRNAGIETARSPLVATLDAGSRVGPGWAAALVRPLQGPGRRVCVGVTVADHRSEFERVAGWFTLHAFKRGGHSSLLRGLPAGRNGYAFARADWEAVGGYPANLPAAEDKVFLRRLLDRGLHVETVPDAVVRWRPRRSLAELYSQYRNYARGDVRAGLERRNELATLALYAGGAALAGAAARGSRGAALTLPLGLAAYLALFVASARRELGGGRTLAWVPLIRLTVDLAKMHGFAEGVLGLRRRSP